MARRTRTVTDTTITSTTSSGIAPGSTLLVIGACGGIGKAVADAARQANVNVISMDLASSFERRGIEPGPDEIPLDLLDESSIKEIGRAHV